MVRRVLEHRAIRHTTQRNPSAEQTGGRVLLAAHHLTARKVVSCAERWDALTMDACHCYCTPYLLTKRLQFICKRPREGLQGNPSSAALQIRQLVVGIARTLHCFHCFFMPWADGWQAEGINSCLPHCQEMGARHVDTCIIHRKGNISQYSRDMGRRTERPNLC